MRVLDDERDRAHRTTRSANGLDRECTKEELLMDKLVQVAQLLNHADIVF